MKELKEDYTGMVFDRLTVIERADDIIDNKGYAQIAWKCKCECGNEFIAMGWRLKHGNNRSCGCMLKEKIWAQKRKNEYRVEGDIVYMKTKSGVEFMFDLDDFDMIYSHSWCATGGYIRTTIKCKKVPIHRFIMGEPDALVDHKDGNPLNNCKSNLRICNHQENSMNHKIMSSNSSGCTGVTWNKRDKRWKVAITYKGTVYYLGCFEDYDEAVRVRKEAENKYFGEFARREVDAS